MLAITILSGSSGECVTSPGNTGLDLFGQREIPSEHLAQMIQHQLGHCLRRVVAACGSKTADSSVGGFLEWVKTGHRELLRSGPTEPC
jgi:hypothetical protein